MKTQTGEKTITSKTLLPAALILALLIAGALLIGGAVIRANRAMRADLLEQTHLVAQAVEIQWVQSLAGTPADLSSPSYLRLKDQFASIRTSLPHCRFVYLLGRKADGTIFFLVDNEPVGSPDEAPAGLIYTNVPTGFQRVFETGLAETEGPYTDRWGTFVSGAVPILNPTTGEVLAVLALDIDNPAWKENLVRAGLPPFFFTLLLVGIVLAYRGMHSRRKSWHQAETMLTVALGIVVTLAATWFTHTNEQRSHRDVFFHLAQSQAARMATAFQCLDRTELEALARFFEGQRDVTPQAFQQFSCFLRRNPAVQAWEWIPAVPAEDRIRFEQAAHAAGFPDFEIWQKDSAGNRIPAEARSTTYPVFYVAPLAGNERALGFDRGSELLRRAGLEKAALTGFTTGTDPLTLVQETASQKGMLVYRPIFDEASPKGLRGFALAVLRMGTLLEKTLKSQTGSAVINLILFHQLPDKPRELLASSLPGNGVAKRAAPFSITYPLFAFGETFSLVATPTPTFARLYPAHAGKMTALTGLSLTLALALVIGMVFQRRKELERLVEDRTESLRTSEAKHRILFVNSPDAYLLITEGVVVDCNRATETLLRGTRDQIIGFKLQDFSPELQPDARRSAVVAEERIQEALHWGNRSFEWTHRRFDGSLFIAEVALSAMSMQGRPVLFCSVRDIATRKLAEEEIKRQSSLINSLLDSIPDIIFFKDVNGVYLGCNPPFAEFIGKPRDAIIGKTDYDLFAPEIAAFFRDQDLHMLDLRKPRHNDEWITYPNGRRLLIDTLKTPYCGPDGTLIGILGISRDITERQRAEEALQQLTNRLSLATRAGGVGIWDYDLVKNALIWDDSMFSLYGIQRETFSGAYEAWQAGLHPDDRQRGDHEIQMALRGEKDFDTEFRVIWPDGTLHSIRALALVVRDLSGKPLRMIGTNWDITAQRAAEQQLRYRVDIENLLVDISTRFMNIDPHLTEQVIHESMELMGTHDQVDRVYVVMLVNGGTAISNTHEWCAPQIEPQIDTLQNIPVSIMPWWMNHLHNLQSIHIPRVSELPPEAVAEREILEAQSIKSLLVVPLVWNGHLVGFLGFDSVRRERVWHHESIAPMEMLGNIIVNALNRKEGELALRASQAALQEINSTLEEKVLERTRQLRDAQLRLFLQERMVSIGQLAAGIAHELNNPIGFIFNNFNALKENMDVVKEVLAAHKTLIDQAESLPLLSEQVQTIKALEDSFKLDLILEDLALLFDDSREGFSRVTAIINSMRDFSRTDRVGELEEFNVNRGIETTLVIARNEYKYVCDVETDLGDLPDIPCIPNQINQVFLNIIVNAAHAIASQNRSGKGTIKIVTSADATTVSCRISDDGPGIPEEISNRIFDPFFTTKAPGKGTGLGLSISYDIVVNKHKGDITVESRVGQGTSFFIRLPRATPPKDGPLT